MSKEARMFDGGIRGRGLGETGILFVRISRFEIEAYDIDEHDRVTFRRAILLAALRKIKAAPVETDHETWKGGVKFDFDRTGRDRVCWLHHVDGDAELDDAYVYRHFCGAEYTLTEKGMDELIALCEEWA